MVLEIADEFFVESDVHDAPSQVPQECQIVTVPYTQYNAELKYRVLKT